MKGAGRAARAAVVVGTLIAVAACPRFAAGGPDPGTGITDSPHDLTAGHGTASTTDEAASICVFCHAPHGGGGQAPVSTRLLWNHRLSAQSFSWSDQTHTVGGTELPTNIGTWAGPSKNCLSCHDGTVAVGDVLRTGSPGLPSFTVTGSRLVDGKIAAGNLIVVEPGGDLSGNHPVGVPYPFGGVPSTYNNIATGPGVELSEYVAAPVNVKLFTDIGNDVITGPTTGRTGIECGSCHDVHNRRALDRPLLRDLFTSGAGASARLCLDCHNL